MKSMVEEYKSYKKDGEQKSETKSDGLILSLKRCQIEGCSNSLADTEDNCADLDSSYLPSSQRIGTDESPYSFSNATSFSDFYNLPDLDKMNREFASSDEENEHKKAHNRSQ